MSASPLARVKNNLHVIITPCKLPTSPQHVKTKLQGKADDIFSCKQRNNDEALPEVRAYLLLLYKRLLPAWHTLALYNSAGV